MVVLDVGWDGEDAVADHVVADGQLFLLAAGDLGVEAGKEWRLRLAGVGCLRGFQRRRNAPTPDVRAVSICSGVHDMRATLCRK